jgi:hypothetical protein
MTSHGFTPSQHDPCLFVKTEETGPVYIMVHVDDALFIGDMGKAFFFLGTKIARHADGGYSLEQPRYVHDMLTRLNMTDCRSASTTVPAGFKLSRYDGGLLRPDHPYQALVGSLTYLAANTGADLSHADDSQLILSRFMTYPTTPHWEAAKHVLRYLKGTSDLCLRFRGHTSTSNQGVCGWELYSDADSAADADKRRSTTRAVMTMQGCPGFRNYRPLLQHPHLKLITLPLRWQAMKDYGCGKYWVKDMGRCLR